jgi:hypothetical protein
MKLAILRWVLYFAAILVAGPLAAAAFSPLRMADGSPDPTVLLASPAIYGVAAILLALLLALAMGVITARLIGSVRAGMIAAGLVLIWPAFASAEIDDVLRAAGGVQPLWVLAVEGGILGVLGLVMALLLVMLGGAGATGDDPMPGHPQQAAPAPASLVARLLGGQILLATGAGLLAGGAAAFFVAATPLKGQALGAAIVGSLAAAVAARLVDLRAPLPGLLIPIVILAIVGPLTGIFLSGSLGAVYSGTMFPLAYIAPMDWLAGAFFGVPLGVAWASSMVEKRTHSGVHTDAASPAGR